MTIHTQIHTTDRGLIVERRERFEGLVDTCQALHNAGLHGAKDMPLYAHVPAVLVEDYLNRTGITFAEFMAEQAHIKRFLNDPALAYFRVSPKQV